MKRSLLILYIPDDRAYTSLQAHTTRPELSKDAKYSVLPRGIYSAPDGVE